MSHGLLAQLIKRGNVENKAEVIKRLVEAGAPLRPAAASDSSNLLSNLVVFDIENRLELAELLMGLGADPNLKDRGGKSALERAADSFQIDLLAVLDPKHSALFWKKYGKKPPQNLLGTWSNQLEGFKIITLMIHENGTANFFAATTGGMTLWRQNEEGHAFLDFLEVREIYDVKVSDIIQLEIKKGSPPSLVLSIDDQKIVFKMVATVEETKKAIEETHRLRQQNFQGVGLPQQAPETPAEAIKRNLAKIADNRGNLILTDWPLKTLPEDFSQENLDTLHIIGGDLEKLTDDLNERFPNLTQIILQDLPLQAIPVNLKTVPVILTKVESLGIVSFAGNLTQAEENKVKTEKPQKYQLNFDR